MLTLSETTIKVYMWNGMDFWTLEDADADRVDDAETGVGG